jgi:hypothetical protein
MGMTFPYHIPAAVRSGSAHPDDRCILYGYRNRCATDAEHWQPVGAQQNDVGMWGKRRDGDHRRLVPEVRTLGVDC